MALPERPVRLPVVDDRGNRLPRRVDQSGKPFEFFPVGGDPPENHRPVTAVVPDNRAVEFLAVVPPLAPLEIHRAIRTVAEREEHLPLEFAGAAQLVYGIIFGMPGQDSITRNGLFRIE